MALQHKLSDAITMRMDKTSSGQPVVEIEFKFIRYRLVVDDKEMALKLIDFMKQSIGKKKKEYEEVKFPKFYKEDM